MQHVFVLSEVCTVTGTQPLPKWVLHRLWSGASSFYFHYPLVPLRSSSSCLRLLPRLPVTSIPLSLSFSNIFRKAIPTQDVTHPVNLPLFYSIQEIPLRDSAILHFSHDRPNWPSPSFSSTTLQNIKYITKNWIFMLFCLTFHKPSVLALTVYKLNMQKNVYTWSCLFICF
jgi:hypothetical protein